MEGFGSPFLFTKSIVNFMEDIIARNLLCENTCSSCKFYYRLRPADGDYDHCKYHYNKPKIKTCNHWKQYTEYNSQDKAVKGHI